MPGGPVVVLAPLDGAGQVVSVATDGDWVYVAQQNSPEVWSIPAAGGMVTPLRKEPAAPSWFPKGHDDVDLTPWEGGVFFHDVFDCDLDAGAVPANCGGQGVWQGHDGTGLRQTLALGLYGPPSMYIVGFEGNGPALVAEQCSTDPPTPGGTPCSTLGTFDAGTLGMAGSGLSGGFVHAVLDDSSGGNVVDVRMDRTSGAAQPIPLLGELVVSTLGGPNAFCTNSACVLDETSAPQTLTAQPAGAWLGIDGDYVYGVVGGSFERVALRSTRTDTLSGLDSQPQAVASARGCLFVATQTVLVRMSAPP